MEKAKEFLTYIIKALVSNPDAVEVEAHADEMGILLTLHVAPEDMGIVIGREGKTADGLRGLLRVLGGREKASFGFKIYDPNPRPKFENSRVASFPRSSDPLNPQF